MDILQVDKSEGSGRIGKKRKRCHAATVEKNQKEILKLLGNDVSLFLYLKKKPPSYSFFIINYRNQLACDGGSYIVSSMGGRESSVAAGRLPSGHARPGENTQAAHSQTI